MSTSNIGKVTPIVGAPIDQISESKGNEENVDILAVGSTKKSVFGTP